MVEKTARLYALVAVIALPCLAQTPAKTATPVTFEKDILPILQQNCQSCHRPGQIGPMPLLTYQQARP